MQRIGEEEQVVEQGLPPLQGVKYYLAVPQAGQSWQMAIYDHQAGRWRSIDVSELQDLATKM